MSEVYLFQNRGREEGKLRNGARKANDHRQRPFPPYHAEHFIRLDTFEFAPFSVVRLCSVGRIHRCLMYLYFECCI